MLVAGLKRKLGPSVAVVATVLLVAPALLSTVEAQVPTPPQPPAIDPGNPPQTAADYYIQTAVVDTHIAQNGKVTNFTDSAKDITVHVTVGNRGLTPTVDLPIIVYDRNSLGSTSSTWRACQKAAIPAGETMTFDFTLRLPKPDTEEQAKHLIAITANNLTDPVPFEQGGCPPPRREVLNGDNTFGRYVVVDYKLDLTPKKFTLCPGVLRTPSDCTLTETHGSGGAYNRAEYDPKTLGDAPGGAPNPESRNFTFTFDLENDKTTATWKDDIDPNGCAPSYLNNWACTSTEKWRVTYAVAYQSLLNPSERGLVLEANDVLGSVNTYDTHLPFFLYKRGGNYSFTLTVDPKLEYPERYETNQQASAFGNMTSPDLAAWISPAGIPTDPKSPAKYDGSGVVRVNVNAFITNKGSFEARNVTGEEPGNANLAGPKTIHWRLYLDEVKDVLPYVRWNATNTSIRAGANFTQPIELTGKNDGSATRITPGKHTLILIADPVWLGDIVDGEAVTEPACGDLRETCARNGRAFESNEKNNKFMLDFYVEDDKKPIFGHFKLNNVGDNYAAGSHTHTLKRAENATWRVNVTEDDAAVKVNLSLKYPNGTIRETPMVKVGQEEGTNKKYFELKLDAGKGYLDLGTYTAIVNATDSQGNKNSSWAFTMKVVDWRIQTKSEWDILANESGNPNTNPPEGATFDQSENPVKFRIRAKANETGIYPDNTTRNKIVEHTYPTGETTNETMSSLESGCPNIPVPLPGQSCLDSDLFALNIAASEIGKHYVKVKIGDLSGKERYIHRNFTVRGPTPQINSWSIQPRVDAGLVVPVRVNVTSPEPVAAVHAVFMHNATSYEANLTLELTDGDVHGGNWTLNVTTGAGRKMVTHAGGYLVKFAAVDEHGTWGLANTTFSLLDGQAPTLSGAAVTPNPQEVNVPVAFKVKGADKTNFTVKLTITRGNEPLETVTRHSTDGSELNFTFERVFDSAGEYRAKFEANDTNNPPLRSSVVEIPFTVSENLPPRIELKQPSFLGPKNPEFSDATPRFGSATPRIQLFVSDRDKLIEDSFALSVNGRNVTLTSDMIVPSTSPPGYTITYDVPATSRFSHNTTVRVNFSATDNSTKRLTGFLPITQPGGTETDRFHVDARPPTSGLPVFDPEKGSYRELDTDVMNVSLDSPIELRAEENGDSAHTEVKAIRFNVLRNGQSQDFVYSPTEKITFRDLFRRGVTNLGSGPYKIQYYAVDAVDNQEQTAKIYDVYLDDLPPSPDLFATRPQGRFVNASWVDNHAGVARVVTWWKLNDGIYQPLEMTESNGIWKTTIPGGKKGDRICYYLQAWDNVDNAGFLQNETNPYSCYPVGNQIPTIRVSEPGNNARLDGTRAIKWTASDPDNEPLTFKIFYRLTGRQNFQELASLPAGTTQYAFDTTKLKDGDYELQVQATDGNFVAFEQITVTIRNNDEAIKDPRAPGEVRPGESVLITALVTKAGAEVEARIYRDGNLVDTVKMRDDGANGDEVAQDGVYSALVTFTEGGTYSVEIFAKYEEDGQQKEARFPDAASFTVRFNPADVFSTYAGLWIAIAALVVACLGVGGYALFRRWRA